MIREAIDRIIELRDADKLPTVEVDGVIYASSLIANDLVPISAQLPKVIDFLTLKGFADYVNRGPDASESCFVKINDHASVSFASDARPDGKRIEWARLARTHQPERLGHWQSPDDAVLFVMLWCEDTPERERLLKIIGNLKEEAIKNVSDDGFTQTVVARQGVATVKEVTVGNPFVLRFFRSFPELKEQPGANYVVRFKGGGQGLPSVGIFEVNDGSLQQSAIPLIAEALGALISEVPIYG